MTIIDKLIPFYVRFVYGFGFISIAIGLISFGMNLVTMITVKGFYTPAWLIPIVGAAVICICIVIGYIFEKKNVLNRISSHSNQNANPEFKELCLNVKEIRKTLEEK